MERRERKRERERARGERARRDDIAREKKSEKKDIDVYRIGVAAALVGRSVGMQEGKRELLEGGWNWRG